MFIFIRLFLSSEYRAQCDEVVDIVTHFEISVVDTKTDVNRPIFQYQFLHNSGSIKYADIIRKYLNLLSEAESRFLTAFLNFKCVNVPIGKNKVDAFREKWSHF